MALVGAETCTEFVYVIILTYNKSAVTDFILCLIGNSFVIKDYLVTWFTLTQINKRELQFQTQCQSIQKQDFIRHKVMHTFAVMSVCHNINHHL